MITNTYASIKVQTSALHRARVRSLLNRLDEKTFSCTAYDTAWVGRVMDAQEGVRPAYPQTLEWLRRHQNADGSWGSDIEFFHDRVISTLSAILTLAKAGNLTSDRDAVARGERYLWRNFDQLANEENDTVAFELLLPMLVDEARKMHLDIPYALCEPYRKLRADKLSMIPPQMLYSRKVSSTHSLEFMGKGLDLDLLAGLQEPNGSFGNSPSATAYVLSHCPENDAARIYLNEVLALDGGAAMPAHPVEVFNKSWVLYNIELTGILNDFILHARPHLDNLWQSWNEQRGVGFSRDYPVMDMDDTAVVAKLLKRAGYPVNPDVFLPYEKDTYFTCYTFERTPSIGANVHLLDTLSVFLSYEQRPRMVKKILRFLRSVRKDDAYWLDKWHISPYYITAHTIIALIGFDNEMARDAVRWMLDTQRMDGSWGYFRPTCEETAYCLQALVSYHNQVEPLDPCVIDRAAEYLYQRYGKWDMPAMWIEKCLYTPPHIVESTILSALIMSVNI